MLTDPTERESEIVSRHFDYLQTNVDAGVVLVAGRTLNTDENNFGIVIFEASGGEAAQAFMQDDPAVNEGVMAAAVFPYRVAIGSHVSEG